MLGHVSWLMVLSVVQAPAASLAVDLEHMAQLAEQRLGSVILKNTVRETVLSAQLIPVCRMDLPATVTPPTVMTECVRLMMINAAFTSV